MALECAATQDVDGALKVGEDATEQIVAGLRALLRLCDADAETIENTPRRVCLSLYEMLNGEDELDRPEELFARKFPAPSDDLIVLKDIEFVSVCKHHLMPFAGQAHVGYVPSGYLVGISKLARLVDYYAHRLQLQEQLCAQIAGAISEHVTDKGAACVIEATHGCLSCRGALKPRATFITSTMFGMFRSDRALRREFFSAINLTHTRI